MVKLRHYDNLGTARFVTFSCYRRLPALNDCLAKKKLIECIDEVRQRHSFRLLGYVVMPEHVHLVLHPSDGMRLGLVVREIKSLSARRYFAKRSAGPPTGKRVFWQLRCYDHNCRTQESTLEKINYCHNNPVKRGLVGSPGEWYWSSYNWYKGMPDVPLKMDEFE
jgi:putative transposase